MEYFTSLSVSSSLIIGISHHIFLLACAPLPCVWTPGLPSPGPAPVPASLGADRGPGGLGLGPAPRQWTRLQRQGDNLPESHKNPDNTGFNIPPSQNGFTVELCLQKPELIATAKCKLPLDVCLANPEYIALPGCLGNSFTVGMCQSGTR